MFAAVLPEQKKSVGTGEVRTAKATKGKTAAEQSLQLSNISFLDEKIKKASASAFEMTMLSITWLNV